VGGIHFKPSKRNKNMTINNATKMRIRLERSLKFKSPRTVNEAEFTQEEIEQAKADFTESLQRLAQIWGFEVVRKLLQAVLDVTAEFEAMRR